MRGNARDGNSRSSGIVDYAGRAMPLQCIPTKCWHYRHSADIRFSNMSYTHRQCAFNYADDWIEVAFEVRLAVNGPAQVTVAWSN